MQKPETVFRQNKVVPFLRKLKHAWFESIQQVGISGSPDILLCIRGKFVALELKNRGEKARPLQQFKLDSIAKAGGISLVADPDNWEKIKNKLIILDQGG